MVRDEVVMWEESSERKGKRKRKREVRTYVHIHLAREQRLAGRMKEHDSLDQLQCAHNQQVVGPIRTPGEQAVQRLDQAQRHVPLEPLLQLEELAECRVIGDLLERLGGRHRFVVGGGAGRDY